MGPRLHIIAVFLLLLHAVAAYPLLSEGSETLQHVSVRSGGLSTCGYETFTSEKETLFVGRDQQPVGYVQFTLSDAGISVTYTVTDSDCKFVEDVHVNIVNEKLTRSAPGRYPCKKDISGPTSSVSINCPASRFSDLECCGDLYVYTHAVLKCGMSSETGYAGDPACEGRQWCNAVKVDPPCECKCEGDACVPKQDCALTTPDSCDSGEVKCPDDCAPGPQVSCGDYPDTCTFDLVCEASECEPTIPCLSDQCPPEGVCPDGPDTPAIPATCIAATECECTSETTCGDPTDDQNCSIQPEVCGMDTCSPGDTKCPADCGTPEPCECGGTTCDGPDACAVKPEMCGSDTCSPGEMKCPDDCGMPSDCGLADCDIVACPADCPDTCPPVCECPNCFLPDTSTDECKCIPDPDENDESCDPCKNAPNGICEDTGLPNSFKCCPPSSNCKSSVIPTRIGQAQADLAVSFICSQACGGPCDQKNNVGESRSCSLFAPLDLGDDGNADTDDIFNVCNDLTLD